MKDVNFRLAAAAVLRGRIADEDGDPMARVQVQLLQEGYQRGKKQLVPASFSSSDDQGEFRIGSVSPGRYYLSAMRTANLMAAGSKETRQYVRTYYPGVLDLQSASAIQVRAGDTPALNLTMRKAETVLVKGTVAGANGETTGNGMLMISEASDAPMALLQTAVREGAFEIRVLPGRYRATAMMGEGGQPSITTSDLNVTPQGLDNVRLHASNAAKVKVHVRIEGGDVAVDNVRLSLRVRRDGAPIFMAGDAGSGKANKEGVVEIERLTPGTFDVQMFPGGKGLEDAYVKSIVQGGRDVSANGVRVASAETQVEVVISVTAAKVEGAVLDGDQHPLKSAIVVAIPDGELRQRDELFRTATTDQNGRFTLRGLRPGRYTVVAFDDIESGAWMDPEVLKVVDARGQRISVGEKEQANAQLRVVPRGELEAIGR